MITSLGVVCRRRFPRFGSLVAGTAPALKSRPTRPNAGVRTSMPRAASGARAEAGLIRPARRH